MFVEFHRSSRDTIQTYSGNSFFSHWCSLLAQLQILTSTSSQNGSFNSRDIYVLYRITMPVYNYTATMPKNACRVQSHYS